MKILITGVAGFIGFNLAEYLIKKKYTIYGLDNFDSYYSIALKKKRLTILNKNKNFIFSKVDIVNEKNLNNFFKNKKIDLIIHLAAQAGVRYSYENPSKYIDTNIFGFLNLIEQAKKRKIKKIMYASSSSVYGDNRNFPLKEHEELNPKNIYAVSKKLNEETAEMYHKIYGINFIGLRFFTIYGEWGRPDMFMFKLFKAFFLKRTFYLNNYGNHLRDFTYIGDAVKIIDKLIQKRTIGNYIFNVCSNNPQNILKIVNKFNKKNKTAVKMINMHKADVLKTHGNNSKINKFLKYKIFSNFDIFFDKTFKWYKENKIYNIK